MKALILYKPGRMVELIEKAVPTIKEDEVLLRVKAATICYTDFEIMEGGKAEPWVRYPLVPGHEFSGIIESCGGNVKHLKPGDRVTAGSIVHCGQCTNCRTGKTNICVNFDEMGSLRDGGFEEYASVPAIILHRINDNLSFEEAALAEPAACAYSAVVHSAIHPGDRVVVIGPGPIGLLAVQFAKLRFPSCVILIGTRDERLKMGRELGATNIINITREDARSILPDITGGLGPNVIIQCANTRSAVELAIDIAGRDSKVVFEGTTGKKEKIELVIDDFIIKPLQLIGVNGFTQKEYTEAFELIQSGVVNVQPLITHRFSLDEYLLAFETVRSRKGGAIKVAFLP